MAEGYHLKDFMPIIAILGPILGAIVGFLLARRVRERRRVTFVLSRAEDLMLPLRRNQAMVSLKVGEREFLSFNRISVYVRNSGNKTIEGFTFDVIIPGLHTEIIADFPHNAPSLGQAIEHHLTKNSQEDILTVSLPFFNAKEQIVVRVFFDNVASEASVRFRMNGVESSVTKTERVTAFAPELALSLVAIYPPPFRGWLRRWVEKQQKRVHQGT